MHHSTESTSLKCAVDLCLVPFKHCPARMVPIWTLFFFFFVKDSKQLKEIRMSRSSLKKKISLRLHLLNFDQLISEFFHLLLMESGILLLITKAQVCVYFQLK